MFPSALGMLAHVLIKPPLALGLARALRLPYESLTGLVLVASAPGAQASSVAVLLAGGDVALSVTIITLLNLVAFVATPLLTKLYAGGARVAVDALGMSQTTMQVVLVPLVLGVACNRAFPAMRSKVAKVSPSIAAAIAVLFAGSGTALIAPFIRSEVGPQAALAIAVAVLFFHVAGSVVTYAFGRAAGMGKREARVLGIQGAHAPAGEVRGRGGWG